MKIYPIIPYKYTDTSLISLIVMVDINIKMTYYKRGKGKKEL